MTHILFRIFGLIVVAITLCAQTITNSINSSVGGNYFNAVVVGADPTGVRDSYCPIFTALQSINNLTTPVSFEWPAGKYVLNPTGSVICSAGGTGELVVTANNVRMFSNGLAVLEQMIFGLSTLQLRGNYDEVDGINCLNTITKIVISGSYEGEPARARAACVYVSGTAGNNNPSYNTVRNIDCNNLVLCFTFRILTETAAAGVGNRAFDNRFHGLDFGALATQQSRLQWQRNWGENTVESQGVDPHQLYLSGATSGSTGNDTALLSGNTDSGNPYGSTFKVKATTAIDIIGNISTGTSRGYDISLGSTAVRVIGNSITGMVSAALTDTQRGCIKFEGVAGWAAENNTCSSNTGVDDVIGIWATIDTENSNLMSSDGHSTNNHLIWGFDSGASGSYYPVRLDGCNNCVSDGDHITFTTANKPAFYLGAGTGLIVRNPDIVLPTPGTGTSGGTDVGNNTGTATTWVLDAKLLNGFPFNNNSITNTGSYIATINNDGPRTVSSGTGNPALYSCGFATDGNRTYVSDASSPTFLGSLTGGSTTRTPVFCSGITSTWVPG